MDKIEKIANNCLSCISKPCQKGCPLLNDTMGFIKLVKEGKYKEAYELSCQTTVLQSICGRICPHNKQCQASCIKTKLANAVEIGKIEALLGDMAIEKLWDIPKITEEKINKKIAIIGGGPAGLTCSAFLARNGYNVTIYEQRDALGGIIEHGIPEFRLDRKVLENTVKKILKLGIKVKYNIQLGKDISIEKLEEEYDAIFIAIGANVSSKMKIKGEDLQGILGGNELLEDKTYPNFKDKTICIIGGGNVAIDVSRTIKKLGAKKVTIIYRRSKEEMPAYENEVQQAINEDIEFMFKTNIIKIIGNDKVEKIECIKTKLENKEGESRKVPINIEKSNFILKTDYVIKAIGSVPNKQIVDEIGLQIDKQGRIVVDKDYRTSRTKVFAGGNIIGAKNTVAWAARTRKRCRL